MPALPVHWRAGRLRWLAKRYAGGTPDRNRLEYWEDGTIPWLNSGAVNQDLITEAAAFITEEAVGNSSARWVPARALVMALAGQGKTKGMTAQLAFTATCNQSMAAIVPNDRIEARFLLWWLRANYQNIRNMSGGDNRDGLNLELLGDIACPLPPLDEQGEVAAFLDRETAKIDALIEEQRRLIALLKEKRQAVISHAVTKGLDPHAPMKDSGIEWLGEVPAHWKVCKLGFQAKLQSGYAFSSNDFGTEGVPVVRMNNLARGKLDLSNAAFIPQGVVNERVTLLEGDLVWGMSGSVGETGSLGNFARVGAADLPCQLNQRVGRFVCSDRLDVDYLEFVIQGESFQKQTLLFVTGTAQFNVSGEQVQSILVATPPLKEQAKIAVFLRETITRYAELMAESNRSISLLHERRAALISAAVTGKIDVRSVVTAEQEREAA